MNRFSNRHSRTGVTRHSRAGGKPAKRHSRAGGKPAKRGTVNHNPHHKSAAAIHVARFTARPVDSRLRGNDEWGAALDAESAEVLATIRGLL